MVESAKSKTGKVHNMVHNDAIWRQVIHNEQNCHNTWDKNWGFMKELTNHSAENRQRPKSSGGASSSLPPISPQAGVVLSAYPVKERLSETAHIDHLLSFNVPQIVNRSGPKDKYTFPGTMTCEYGWDWPGRPVNVQGRSTLEMYGRHAKGRMDTLKWWGGARESLP
ncbi:hypothetical protein RI367_003973 [Sorochytrium milnesiophthora]